MNIVQKYRTRINGQDRHLSICFNDNHLIYNVLNYHSLTAGPKYKI